jgi:hypothetical protein
MWGWAQGFDAPRNEGQIQATCVRFLRSAGSYKGTNAALRGLCPTGDSEVTEFFLWSGLSWFQLKAASRKAALNFSHDSSPAGTSSSITIQRRDLASRLKLDSIFEESLVLYETRHGPSFVRDPSELTTFLDFVRKSRPIFSRLQRYVLELGAEFEECLAVEKKQVTKMGEDFHRLHDALFTDLVNDRPILDFFSSQVLVQSFVDSFDRDRMRRGFFYALESLIFRVFNERLSLLIDEKDVTAVSMEIRSGRMADVLYHISGWLIFRTCNSRHKILLNRLSSDDRSLFESALNEWCSSNNLTRESAELDDLPTSLVTTRSAHSLKYPSRVMWEFICVVEEFVGARLTPGRALVDGSRLLQRLRKSALQLQSVHDSFLLTCAQCDVVAHNLLSQELLPDLLHVRSLSHLAALVPPFLLFLVYICAQRAHNRPWNP